jgi:hypothetical protein
MHAVLVTQETPLGDANVVPFGFGIATIDHRFPFQDSAITSVTCLLVRYDPTAMHRVGLTHEIAFRELLVVPAGTGAGMTDSFEPFHRSVSKPPAPACGL